MTDDEFKPVYRELGGEVIPVSYGRDLSPLIKARAWEDAFEDEDMLTIVRKRLERDSGRRHSFEDALARLGITREELDEEDDADE